MWWKKFQIFFSQNLEKISGPKAIFWQTDREYIPYLFWFFAFWRNFAPQRNAGSNVFYENSWKYLANTYLPSYAHIFVARIFWQRNYILSESVGGGVRGEGGGDRTWDLSPVGRVLSFLMCPVFVCLRETTKETRRRHWSGHGRTSRLRFPEALDGRAGDGVQRISRQ